MFRHTKTILILILGFSSVALSQGTQTPAELGKVAWVRDFEQGLARAKKEQKPVFLLFQEVPGCSTCQRYGAEVLSHPLIAEAIESLFIPVAIYNNKGGKDAEMLKLYNEPAWNNPVVRIVDASKKNLAERVSGNYTPLAVLNAMLVALEKSNLVVPTYLALLREELQSKELGTKTATLSMYCFWTGEKELGKIPGVVATEAGFMAGREVVTVEYNPRLLSFENLIESGSKVKCADGVFTADAQEQAKVEKVLGKGKVKNPSTYRPDPESKYYLYQSHYRYLPMTELQAARANSLLAGGKSPEEVLSPRQIELARQIKANPKKNWKPVIGKSVTESWPWPTA
jgi:thioredoxin-related protein